MAFALSRHLALTNSSRDFSDECFSLPKAIPVRRSARICCPTATRLVHLLRRPSSSPPDREVHRPPPGAGHRRCLNSTSRTCLRCRRFERRPTLGQQWVGSVAGRPHRFTYDDELASYRRLEYLGDSVRYPALAKQLFRLFPNAGSGVLSVRARQRFAKRC